MKHRRSNFEGDVACNRQWNVAVAMTSDGGIGKNGRLPWRLPHDLRYFQQLTKYVDPERFPQQLRKNVVVMGRNTWESIRRRPLPERINVIVTSTLTDNDVQLEQEGASCVRCVSSIEAAKELIHGELSLHAADVFVIGGSGIFSEVLTNHIDLIWRAFVTRIGIHVECDVYTSPLPTNVFVPVSVSSTYSENSVPYDFVVYENVRHHPKELSDPSCGGGRQPNFYQQLIDLSKEDKDDSSPRDPVECLPSVVNRRHSEFAYLDLIREILTTGYQCVDRTGVGTLALFGKTMKFNLRKSFPLLTTKRVFWRGVVEELLWFIKGDTNANHLTEKGVKIWQPNGSRDFLDKLGLTHREVGDLGPVYGFQWRHFGAAYTDMHSDYTGQGVDQLQRCINLIKNNPSDRRIIMSAWNPSDLSLMALPPCHMFCQFYVSNGELSCCMYQRAADMGLGVPFNIASYSLLTVMVATVCGLKPGDFVHVLGNAHVYLNHIDPLKEQLTRLPRPLPILKVNKESPKGIDDFTASDFELIGYHPYPAIPMEMAV